MKLTVYFDSDFWYGLIEYETLDGRYGACKYLFGKEPKDSEVLEFVNTQLLSLVNRQEHVLLQTKKQETVSHKRIKNPKRMQREINKEKQKPVVSTKAQKTISEVRNELKQMQKKFTKQQKADLKAQRFLQKQEKKRQKKKGH